MPKPSPAPSKDHHGHEIVPLPGGGEIIPEHFHEGPAAAQRFSKAVRGVLAVPHAAAEKAGAAMQTKHRRQRAKPSP